MGGSPGPTVDPAIPVCTETDKDGEPKCPDACSSFVHWDRKFTGCQGGDANHHDHWLWFDDKLPGGGNAAAVGGDWGLTDARRHFINAFSSKSFGIVEHEMGHGFGFQDYCNWTGSRPSGGSLMIAQPSSRQSPTVGVPGCCDVRGGDEDAARLVKRRSFDHL